MPTIKEVLKAVRDEALTLASENDLAEADLADNEPALLLLVATVVMKQLESSGNVDVCTGAKAARKQLKPHLSRCIQSAIDSKTKSLKRSREAVDDDSSSESEEPHASTTRVGDGHKKPTSSPPSTSLSLGQYASAGAFKGDESKQAKFARLMGGAHSDVKGEQRNTQAADDKTITRINRDLENQYEFALNHKGKKGLGA